MSARNGDKARFGKQRKRRMALRLKTRALREGLRPEAQVNPGEGSSAEASQGEHHGVLGTAAAKIGSALGSLAAKAKTVRQPEPAPAE